MAEKRKDFSVALDGYLTCLKECNLLPEEQKEETENSAIPVNPEEREERTEGSTEVSEETPKELEETPKQRVIKFLRELRGEIMLRIAVLRKEMGAVEQAMLMCNSVANESFGDSIRANALCLKVDLIHYILFIF